MRALFAVPRPARALPLLLGLLSACEQETGELVSEIEAARAGCTREGLKASSEECVAMMQRYAEMGTEAIHTYIGGVKSLDRALDRMPPPDFDTTGLGHAFGPTSGAAEPPRDSYPWRSSPDSAASLSRSLGTAAYSRSRAYAEPAYGSAWDEDYPGGGYDPRYGGAPYDPRYGGAPYDPRYDGRSSGGYDPRYADPRYGGREDEGYDPRYDERRYDERRYDDARGRWEERGAAVPRRAGPPARGELLPPEERLARPWLREGADGRYREAPRSRPLRSDTLSRRDEVLPRTRQGRPPLR